MESRNCSNDEVAVTGSEHIGFIDALHSLKEVGQLEPLLLFATFLVEELHELNELRVGFLESGDSPHFAFHDEKRVIDTETKSTQREPVGIVARPPLPFESLAGCRQI